MLLSPAPGSSLPADPTLYLFVPSWRDDGGAITARAGERSLPVTVRQLSRSDAFTSYAVAIDTDGPGPITVEVGDGPTREYRIARGWTPVGQRRIAPLTSVHREDAWTCSHTDLWEVRTDGWAPALRVEWATRAAAFDDGAANTAIVPPRMSDFWRWGAGDDARAPAVLELGHVNCFAQTIPAAAVHGPLYVRITPLFSDGSAGDTGEVVQVGSAEPVAAAAVAEPPAKAVPAPARPARRSCVLPVLAPWSHTIGVALVAGALFGIALALGRSGRRGRYTAVVAGRDAIGSAIAAAACSVVPWPWWTLLAIFAVTIPALVVVELVISGRSRS